jgi:hypothetical protein
VREGKTYYAYSPHPGWKVLVLDPYIVAAIGYPEGSEQLA